MYKDVSSLGSFIVKVTSLEMLSLPDISGFFLKKLKLSVSRVTELMVVKSSFVVSALQASPAAKGKLNTTEDVSSPTISTIPTMLDLVLDIIHFPFSITYLQQCAVTLDKISIFLNFVNLSFLIKIKKTFKNLKSLQKFVSVRSYVCRPKIGGYFRPADVASNLQGNIILNKH
ncbi:MAG: hypothetical protein COA94_02885 [Rickettsiales bacterium]|nr:MAG: hypothetical protein COA94_02885 [Rickettsiales bacterium]